MMKIEVIATGTELLKGSAVNTNLAAIGRMLHQYGFTVNGGRIVGDSRADLIGALHRAAVEAELVIVTGGLGPTADDITRDVAAELFGLNLARDPAIADRLRRYYRRRHGEGRVPKELFRQAEVPVGAEVLENRNGSAPGLYFAAPYGGKIRHVYLLPGPPTEMEPMFEAALPAIHARFAGEARRHTGCFLVASGAELNIQRAIEPVLAGRPVELAYCAGAEGTKVFITGADASVVDEAVELARRRFGDAALPAGHTDLAAEVLELARRRQWHLALAESCTGGLIGAALTEVAGASSVFLGSLVAYDNAVKERLLGVPPETLRRSGAVSAETAVAMAAGARNAFGAELAAAVTGIAGPDGGTADKPVGLVYVAACRGDRSVVRECRFGGGRAAVRQRARAAVLLLLRDLLLDLG